MEKYFNKEMRYIYTITEVPILKRPIIFYNTMYYKYRYELSKVFFNRIRNYLSAGIGYVSQKDLKKNLVIFYFVCKLLEEKIYNKMKVMFLKNKNKM